MSLRKVNVKYLTTIQFLVILVLVYRSYRPDDLNGFKTSDLWGKKAVTTKVPPTHQRQIQILPSTSVNVSVIKPSVVDAPETSSVDVQRHRIDHAREVCEKYVKTDFWRKLVPHGVVWSHGGVKDIHYCIVPKVGCTYWKRIFRFLNKDFPLKTNVTKPSDINRNFVHYGSLRHTNQTSMADRVSMQLFSGSQMFMFARDPYSRMWSAYIDKFLLPDFWRTAAIDAMRRVRVNATALEIRCPKDITFVEYIRYIVLSRNNLNEHWTPTHRLCSPCHARYDVIGKQETFGQDSAFILNRYGLGHLIEEQTSGSRAQEETSMLIEYNFGLENAIVSGCFQRLDVANRLWKAFQFNGYIDRNTPFPVGSLNNATFFKSDPKAEFSRLLNAAIKDQKDRGLTFKSQKREMMAEAFREVPIDLMRELQDIFKYDFELFEYETEPKDLYER